MSDKPVYWLSPVGGFDDFGRPIDDEFIDGRTNQGGIWAIMSLASWKLHGGTGGRLGLGLGQQYRRMRMPDGQFKWLKVEG